MPVDLCRIEYNAYDQAQCLGCKETRALFARLKTFKTNHRAESPSATQTFGTVKIHENYHELSRCAEKCIACQTFQRGILLQQITVNECHQLQRNPSAVYATLRGDSDRSSSVLQVSIGLGKSSICSNASIWCSETNILRHPKGISNGADWKQLRSWIDQCNKEHSCRKYRWSNRSPSWLIKILPQNQVQLVRGSSAGSEMDQLVPYVALSYCWGDPSAIMKEDPHGMERIQHAHTQVRTKGQPVAIRLHPFSRAEYPETMQDAIAIVEDLGVEYIWIDNVCIPEQEGWEIESAKMHEVYGNAYFILFACAAEKAIDRLRIHRAAWDHTFRGCKFYGHWLAICDPTLSEVRMANPLAQRGWILQEERLSPRILYWCAQRAYWSCCESQTTESRQSDQESPSGTDDSRPPQHFVMLSRSGITEDLHREWLGTVESYCRRGLTEHAKEKDRFRAISGLAVRYLSAGNARENEYLAGLWRSKFAHELSWRVTQPVDPRKNLKAVAPTWSWASLPLCTDIGLLHDFADCKHFELLEESKVGADHTARDVVANGEAVRPVKIRSRFRRFIGPDSALVPWESVWRTRGDQTVFNMDFDPGQPIHARGPSGQVLVYEAHKDEVLAQLDYLDVAFDEKNTGGVAMGTEQSLYCFELGKAAMVLLEEIDEQSCTYERVGVAIDYRQSFFDGYEPKEISLR